MKTFNRFLYSLCVLAMTGILPPAGFADTGHDRVGEKVGDHANFFFRHRTSPFSDLKTSICLKFGQINIFWELRSLI